MCDLNDNTRFCYACHSRNIASEPTPFEDEDGRTVVAVYRCRDCQALYVPEFDEAA